MNLSRYNGTEIANLALGQAGVDIISGTTSTITAGESVGQGVCDEGIVVHTTKAICNAETGPTPHTNAPLATHPNTDHWRPSFDRWISVVILGDGASSIVLTPVNGDVVTINSSEQDDLIGIAMPGPWKSIQGGGTGSNLMCNRG